MLQQRAQITRIAAWLWFAATLAVMAVAFREALFLAPTEATMGNIQRIFYYHVPFAIFGLIFPYVNLAASLGYLYFRTRNPLSALTADALALASAEVTVLYTSVGLMTGMLWAKPVWGIWWTWDARLTTYFILWLLYVSYLLTRRFTSAGGASGQTSALAAVLSIFAAVDVPIVYMSIRWWRTQHPSPVFGGGADSGLDPSLYPAFLWNIAGWAMWGIFILLFRFALERRRQLAEQEAALRTIEASLEIPQ
jgi:heme exporter protein C